MTNKSLTRYIKDSLAAGFTAEEIQTALLGAGWDSTEVTQAFATPAATPGQGGLFTRYAKPLMVALAVLVALPALGFGGAYLYSQYASRQYEQLAVETNNSQAQESAAPPEDQAAAGGLTERDGQRLSDIQTLQEALRAFFGGHNFYPKALGELVKDGRLGSIPLDPKLNQPYAYFAFGEPPNQYSLSFLLEGGVGELRSGLQVVSSTKLLPAATLLDQEALVQGQKSVGASGDLLVTDLSKSPFYPSEEVVLEVAAPPGVELKSSKIVTQDLGLLDQSPPFVFRFSAPRAEGVYEVKVFGFDMDGRGHVGQTVITVTAAEENF